MGLMQPTEATLWQQLLVHLNTRNGLYMVIVFVLLLCGAVSGALMVLGLKFGHFESENQEQKSKNYGISVDFTNRVKEKCGSIVCKEMLNADLTTEEGKGKIAEKNLFRTLCPKIIADVVEILEKVIAENSEE